MWLIALWAGWLIDGVLTSENAFCGTTSPLSCTACYWAYAGSLALTWALGGAVVLVRTDLLAQDLGLTAGGISKRIRPGVLVFAPISGILLVLLVLPQVAPAWKWAREVGAPASTAVGILFSLLVWGAVRCVCAVLIARCPPGKLAGHPRASYVLPSLSAFALLALVLFSLLC